MEGTIFLNDNLDLQNNSSSLNYDYDESSQLQDTAVTIFVTVFSFVISLIGIIVNTIVCLVVLRKRKMQTSINVVLVTLAIGDILFCLFYIMTSPTYYIFDGWIFGKWMCFTSAFVAEFYEFYSIITICTSMCLFLWQKVNLKMTYVTITIIGLCAATISLFRVIFTQLYVTKDGRSMCTVTWINNDFAAIHLHIKLVINVVIPFVMVIMSFVLRIMFKFDKNASAIRLLMAIMLIYVLFWSPLTVLQNIDLHYGLQISHFVYMFFDLLSYFTVVYKPILYYKMDENFMKEISQCIKTKPSEFYLPSN